MTCHVPGCGNVASWRTTVDNVVLLLCIRHMELACDMGVKDEAIVAIPEKEEAL